MNPTIFIDEDIKLSVKRGIYWLDENHPDWEYRIDLPKLKMSACHVCIIGQAVGDFYGTLAQAVQGGNQDGWAEDHGFQSPAIYNEAGQYDSASVGNYYIDLETLWTDEVRKRLG